MIRRCYEELMRQIVGWTLLAVEDIENSNRPSLTMIQYVPIAVAARMILSPIELYFWIRGRHK